MDEIKLSTQLVNAILGYLGSRPFAEVAGLIQGVQQEAAKQGALPVAAVAGEARDRTADAIRIGGHRGDGRPGPARCHA